MYRRRFRRSRRSGADWARYHVGQRQVLSTRYAGIDKDVEKAFFDLRGPELELLLHRYKEKYGAKAAEYARGAYPRWRNGSVRMSGQTAQRLLDLLPPLLSADARLELIRKLRAHYIKPDHITVTTSPGEWRSSIEPAIEKIIQKASTCNLPLEVTQGARWLVSDDTKAAQLLLAKIEEEEARVRTSLLEQEFGRLERVAQQLAQTATSFEHVIRIPNGEIIVKLITAKKWFFIPWSKEICSMKEQEETPQAGLTRTSGAPIARRPDSNLLDVATGGLTEEEVRQLRGKALDAKLQLDVAAREADHRFVNSSRDMANTVRLAQELDQGRNDYDINSNFDTASGRTTVRVKRATNQAVVVVAVVIAIVLLLIFLNR